jgi:hypothetical protein
MKHVFVCALCSVGDGFLSVIFIKQLLSREGSRMTSSDKKHEKTPKQNLKISNPQFLRIFLHCSGHLMGPVVYLPG